MSDAIDDDFGRRMWRGARGHGAGCPDAMDLAAYADRRADAATADRVEAALADCRESVCLCLAAVAAARQPAIEPVPAASLAAARALVAERPARRAWRVAQWAAAAAAVVLAAQLGFNLGMSTAGYASTVSQLDEAGSASDWVALGGGADL